MARVRRGGHKPPTMNDVAALAGVSQSTVSFVVNDRPGARIGEATRKRVLEAVEELGFRTDLTARALKTGQTLTIGMLTDRIASTPFGGRIIVGAQEAAWRRDVLVLLADTGDDDNVQAAAVNALLDRRVDGLLFSAQSTGLVELPVSAPTPTVLVNCFDEAGTPSVIPDEEFGGGLAMRAVLDAGHTNVLYLAGEPDRWATAERIRGMAQAARAAGVTMGISYGGYDTDSGYERMREVARGELPTAILCASDRVALGVMLALSELSLRCPEDISVVGYDNQEYLAEVLHPALTTVELPFLDLGRRGVEQMFALAAGKKVDPQIKIRGRLVRRDSLARPRG